MEHIDHINNRRYVVVMSYFVELNDAELGVIWWHARHRQAGQLIYIWVRSSRVGSVYHKKLHINMRSEPFSIACVCKALIVYSESGFGTEFVGKLTVKLQIFYGKCPFSLIFLSFLWRLCLTEHRKVPLWTLQYTNSMSPTPESSHYLIKARGLLDKGKHRTCAAHGDPRADPLNPHYTTKLNKIDGGLTSQNAW